MYGAPEYKEKAGILDNLKKGANRFAAKAQKLSAVAHDPKDLYNNTPEKGSQYKGRLLVNVRIEDHPPQKDKYKGKKEPFRRKVPAHSSEPQTRTYILKCLVIMGSEIPKPYLTSSKIQLRVSIGHYDAITPGGVWNNGMVRWDPENGLLMLDNLSFPSATSQIPDVFLYITADGQSIPYCFARIKSHDLLKAKFNDPAKWFVLKEDKVINALDDGEYPGQVLIKIGLGTEEDALATRDVWDNVIEDVKSQVPYLVRVHVYQAHDLEAADSNGLSDPWLAIKFNGQHAETDRKTKTLYPTYYQTFDFDTVLSDKREFMPLVTFLLYDQDLTGSEYMGTAQFNLLDASMSDEGPAKDPQWIPFFKEEPGDGEGELLVSVELIRKDPGVVIPPLPPYSIRPTTYDAWIEVIILGLRNLAPFNFQAIQNPFLEFVVEDGNGSHQRTCTRNSKKPSPANPNFLEKLVLPVQLPTNPMFAQPLFLNVKDIRLGGYSKPLIASGVVKLDKKIPGSKNYQPPGKQAFYRPHEDRGMSETTSGAANRSGDISAAGVQGGGSPSDALIANHEDIKAASGRDEVYYKIQQKLDQRSKELKEDPLIASAQPMDLNGFIVERKAKEDSGAGLFGALQHVDLDAIDEIRQKRGYDQDEDNDYTFGDDEDQEPKWKQNRTILSGDLESELETTPFETYKLYRGKKNSIMGKKMVGIMKGLIRIRLTNNPTDTCFDKELLEQLQKPQAYKIRLYVLEAKGLTPMDRDIFGKPAKSDPYLKVQLGDFKFNDRENAIDDVVDVDFYKVVEMDTELPGTSQLTVHVMDKEIVGYDKLIGSTVIDLEDRWFDERWQNLGRDFRQTPGENGSLSGRWDPKPVEKRTLYIPSNNASQGVIQLWVDILEPAVAAAFPPEDVALPPTKVFEMRVVIWKVRNVPAADTFENMSDLFVKAWPEGCDPHETDTHW